MTVRKWGTETIVNISTTSLGASPATTALNDGGWVTVWRDGDAASGDGDGASIKFQRYDVAGVQVGGEVIANSGAAGSQDSPSIITTSDGGFVIAWIDSNDAEFRRFNAAGVALDVADVVFARANSQFRPDLATNGTGFLIGLEETVAGDGNLGFQAFLASGATTGAFIDVAATAAVENSLNVVELAAGGFVAAWRDQTSNDIMIRGFDGSGVQTFAAKDVSTPANTALTPSITALENGSFVVAWRISDAAYPDLDPFSVRGRIVAADGTLIGSEFTVNTLAEGGQSVPKLTALATGGFVAIYVSGGVNLHGQVFGSDGERIGSEFAVNTSANAASASVTALADGRFVVAWVAGDDIHQQIFDPRDGVVMGTEAADTLLGHDLLNDELNGQGGADTLNGLGGSDFLNGGVGDDTYIVGVGDTVFETLNGGIDTVRSALSFALGDNLENLVLTGAAAVNGAGNTLVNTITGNGAANVLNGLAGIDTLFGAGGNDTYVLGGDADLVTDTAGIDTITSTISRNLASFAGIENLTLIAGVAGTGTPGANIITGNAASNVLNGLAGNDRLLGGAGADTLIGGLNKDTMTGGAHNDVFTFSAANHSGIGALADVITDFDRAGMGDDRINLSALLGPALVYRHNGAFTAAGQVRIVDVAGPDVVVEVNLAGAGGAEMQIRLTNTTLASMTATDFLL